MSLEGGYEPASLRDSVKAVLLELAGLSETDTAEILASADREKLRPVLKKILKTHRLHWPSLSASLEPFLHERQSLNERLRDVLMETITFLRS